MLAVVASVGKAAAARRKVVKPPRVRRDPTEARAEILRAAETALEAVAFGALTVDDVMRRTGMTRSAFYHYFTGLDEVALGLLEQCEHDIRTSVDPWLRGETDDADPVRATTLHLTTMFDAMETHRTAIRAVAQAAGGHPRVYQEWQTRVLDYFFDLTERFIQRQIDAGRSAAKDPAQLARALILMNNAVANDSMTDDVRADPAAVARVLADVWNAAIYGRTA